MNVAECLEEVLAQHGVTVLPLLPGGPLMPFLRAVHARRRVKTVLCRHESAAVMMADGYYRLSHRVAAVAVTAGPGLSNTVTAVALAHAEQIPLVLISAQVATECDGRTAAQELDSVTLLRPVTKASRGLWAPRRAQAVLTDLIRIAVSGRPGPVHLSVPADAWGRSLELAPHGAALLHSRACDFSTTHTVTDLLQRAARPVLLAGYGVVQSQASRELLALASALPRLRVACTPRAKGVFPESHPSSLGVFGFAGHARAEHALLEDNDLLLVVGSRLGEIASSSWDERLGRQRLIQIDIEPAEIGRNFPVELGMVGDAKLLLGRLAEMVVS
jgi:acetolactate synthase-1/2/3 large subunit